MLAQEGEEAQNLSRWEKSIPFGDIGELILNSLDTEIFQMASAISANILAHTIVSKDWLKYQLGFCSKVMALW